jgi:hypothetical protein
VEKYLQMSRVNLLTVIGVLAQLMLFFGFVERSLTPSKPDGTVVNCTRIFCLGCTL